MKTGLITGLLGFILTSLSVQADMQRLTGMVGVEYQTIRSDVLDHDYHIFVQLPKAETSDTKTRWPVLYLLDGGNTFPMLSTYHKYLRWPGDTPAMMLVGISYGTDDWRQGNRRSTDYTLPAEGRDHYGGAEAFHRFLSEELMPMIERQYPADPNQRLLFGHSLGGQFALYCAQFKPDSFAGIIASNPAIHHNAASFMQGLPEAKSSPRLVVVQADGDDQQYQEARQQWLDYWQNRPHHWQQQVINVTGHNHMSSVPAAFRQGLMWLYPPQPSTTTE